MWLSLRDKNGTGLFDFNVGSSSGGRGGEGWIWTWKSTAIVEFQNGDVRVHSARLQGSFSRTRCPVTGCGWAPLRQHERFGLATLATVTKQAPDTSSQRKQVPVFGAAHSLALRAWIAAIRGWIKGAGLIDANRNTMTYGDVLEKVLIPIVQYR